MLTEGFSLFVSGCGFGSSGFNAELQNAIDSGNDYFQVKIGLQSATDGDGATDIFQLHPDSATLEVRYNYNE